MNIPATLLCDFYKLSHRVQYPEGTEVIYSTWTPRSNKHFPKADEVVAFGFQAFIKTFLIDYFNTHFFTKAKEDIIEEYTRVVRHCLGESSPFSGHIEELHDLGYLPVKIEAIPEGMKVPLRTPMLTITNTDKRFFWVTNYLETLASCELWQPSTSATIAGKYRELLDRYAMETVGNKDFVPFQGHDFSMRGMGGCLSAASSGAGHLVSFVGTDTIPAILHLERNYNADITKELVGTSIPATEHSVMCAGGDGEGEYETYKRLISEVYPSGFVSIVSDTWDLWNTITNILPRLKSDIMARDGKVVIRPDSGNPADIVCGTGGNTDEGKGVIELLWDIFGGTINRKGYKELDPHIGCIYGEAITLDMCEDMCRRLAIKGFASTNVVYGIGSYTYQYNTRDTFGFALKSTLCVIDGEERFIYKDPKTDDGIKKSQTGAVAVFIGDFDNVYYIDELTRDHATHGNIMRPIFEDGKLLIDDTLQSIRDRMSN
jgi:nicotinamide phosphoribosyltransferase